MKTSILLILLISLLSLPACQEVKNAQETVPEEQKAINSVEGAWEFVSAKVVLPDTVIVFDAFRGILIMSDAHFAFVSSSPDTKEVASVGWGTYTAEGNTHTITRIFHTATDLIGTSSKYEHQIKGDTLFKAAVVPVWDGIRDLAGGQETVRIEEVRVRAKMAQ